MESIIEVLIFLVVAVVWVISFAVKKIGKGQNQGEGGGGGEAEAEAEAEAAGGGNPLQEFFKELLDIQKDGGAGQSPQRAPVRKKIADKPARSARGQASVAQEPEKAPRAMASNMIQRPIPTDSGIEANPCAYEYGETGADAGVQHTPYRDMILDNSISAIVAHEILSPPKALR